MLKSLSSLALILPLISGCAVSTQSPSETPPTFSPANRFAKQCGVLNLNACIKAADEERRLQAVLQARRTQDQQIASNTVITARHDHSDGVSGKFVAIVDATQLLSGEQVAQGFYFEFSGASLSIRAAEYDCLTIYRRGENQVETIKIEDGDPRQGPVRHANYVWPRYVYASHSGRDCQILRNRPVIRTYVANPVRVRYNPYARDGLFSRDFNSAESFPSIIESGRPEIVVGSAGTAIYATPASFEESEAILIEARAARLASGNTFSNFFKLARDSYNATNEGGECGNGQSRQYMGRDRAGPIFVCP